jgi:hypothetical protein
MKIEFCILTAVSLYQTALKHLEEIIQEKMIHIRVKMVKIKKRQAGTGETLPGFAFHQDKWAGY